MIDAMCYEKLIVSDILVLVTPEHIGRSTIFRIAQAMKYRIPIYTFTDGKLEEFELEDY